MAPFETAGVTVPYKLHVLPPRALPSSRHEHIVRLR